MSLKVWYWSRFEDLEIQVEVEKLQVLENKLWEEFDQQIWSKLQEQNVATWWQNL